MVPADVCSADVAMPQAVEAVEVSAQSEAASPETLEAAEVSAQSEVASMQEAQLHREVSTPPLRVEASGEAGVKIDSVEKTNLHSKAVLPVHAEGREVPDCEEAPPMVPVDVCSADVAMPQAVEAAEVSAQSEAASPEAAEAVEAPVQSEAASLQEAQLHREASTAPLIAEASGEAAAVAAAPPPLLLSSGHVRRTSVRSRASSACCSVGSFSGAEVEELLELEPLGPDDQRFTPKVVNPACCQARTWAGGVGGQCRGRKVGASSFCRAHGDEKWMAHGHVCGTIPPLKLTKFLRQWQLRKWHLEVEIDRSASADLGKRRAPEGSAKDDMSSSPLHKAHCAAAGGA